MFRMVSLIFSCSILSVKVDRLLLNNTFVACQLVTCEQKNDDHFFLMTLHLFFDSALCFNVRLFILIWVVSSVLLK